MRYDGYALMVLLVVSYLMARHTARLNNTIRYDAAKSRLLGKPSARCNHMIVIISSMYVFV